MKKNNSIEKLVEEGLVTTADKFFVAGRYIVPNPIYTTNENGTISVYPKPLKWVLEIEDYCSSVGILPEDLIKCHQDTQKGIKKKKLTKDAQNEQGGLKTPAIDKKDHSNWNENYKKRKLFGE